MVLVPHGVLSRHATQRHTSRGSLGERGRRSWEWTLSSTNESSRQVHARVWRFPLRRRWRQRRRWLWQQRRRRHWRRLISQSVILLLSRGCSGHHPLSCSSPFLSSPSVTSPSVGFLPSFGGGTEGCWHVDTTHYGHGALPVSLSAAACKPEFQRQTTP